MYQTRQIHIKKNHPAYNYFVQNTTGSRAVRNTVNFLIRNTMTGIQKSPEERTHHETEVLHMVFTSIQKLNAARKAKDPDKKLIPYPTAKKWMLSYEVLDAIMKYTKNESYYSCTSQVNQQAIRKTCKAWKSYFSLLKTWKQNPSSLNGKPKIPGYIRSKQATAHFTNQICKCEKRNGNLYISFACLGEFCFGSEQVLPGEFVKAEVKPYHGDFMFLLTYQTTEEEPKRQEHPERILGIDIGLQNFLTCADNTGNTPFIISGGWMKAQNQWFNKRRAFLVSQLTKGKGNKHSQKDSKALQALSRKRDDRLRDFFYKSAYFVCRKCKDRDIQTIVIGHNKAQKQGSDLGSVTNQNFVSIPFTQFISCLKTVAAHFGIVVIEREESYTSKANIFQQDPIPTYKKNTDIQTAFTGKRPKRGLYCADDGKQINADVNGACNILRKEFPYAFHDIDLSYLAKTVDRIKGETILGIKHKENKAPKRSLISETEKKAA